MKKNILTFVAFAFGMLSAFADNISVAGVSITSGETATVSISLNNTETNFVSFQMDLTLPEEITLNKAECSLSSRFADETQKLVIGKQPNGNYRLTSTSFSLTPITGTTGEIITLSLSASTESESAAATISNIIFATNDSRKVTMSDVSFNITIVRVEQTLESTTTLPTLTYGDGALALPTTTDEGMPLSWTVEDTAIASINEGMLNNHHAGSTKVTATQAGNKHFLPFERVFTLTVNKAMLTITANNCEKLEDDENPELTVSYDGFQYNDDASSLTTQPTLTTTATTDCIVGTYPITASGAESDDYEFTYVSGTLTVNPNPRTLIHFADENTKLLCTANWDLNGDEELSEKEAGLVTDLGEVFNEQGEITSFEELHYFTGLASIGTYAFNGCTSLTSVIIPVNVTSIGVNPFAECSSLTSIVVDAENTKYDSQGNCNAIIETETNTLISGCKNTYIHDGIEAIGQSAFLGCSGLTSLSLPSSITSLEETAFMKCSSLTAVTIPSSVTTIGNGVFADCGSLTTIVVEEGSTIFDSRGECNAIIETETNILIAGCKNTTVPYGVTSIGEYAFYDCKELTTLNIPGSVTNIDSYAISGCNTLTTVIVGSSNPSSITIGNNNSFNQNNATLYVPKGSKTAYRTASIWKSFKEIIEYVENDVNMDGETDVVDVVDIARNVIGTPAETFVKALADVNCDGWWDIADAVMLVNLIAGDLDFAKSWTAPKRISDSGESLNLYCNRDNHLSLVLKNERDYTAFQFDLYVPEDANVEQILLNEQINQTHQLLYNKVEDRHYRVAALSFSNDPFNSNSGELLNIIVEGISTEEVSIRNIHFFTPDGSDYRFNDILTVTNVATGVSDEELRMKNEELHSTAIYDLQGRCVSIGSANAPSPHKKGIYIIDGKKVMAK